MTPSLNIGILQFHIKICMPFKSFFRKKPCNSQSSNYRKEKKHTSQNYSNFILIIKKTSQTTKLISRLNKFRSIYILITLNKKSRILKKFNRPKRIQIKKGLADQKKNFNTKKYQNNIPKYKKIFKTISYIKYFQLQYPNNKQKKYYNGSNVYNQKKPSIVLPLQKKKQKSTYKEYPNQQKN